MDADAHFARGVRHYEAEEYPLALASFSAAVTLRPGDAHALYNRAVCRHLLGDRAGALADLDAALSIAPRNAAACALRGELHLAGGQPTAAVADLEVAATAGEDPEVWRLLGQAYLESDHPEAGRAALDRALECTPATAHLHCLRAEARYRCGDPAGARQDFDAAIGLDASCARAFGGRAILGFEQGEDDGVVRDLERAAELYRNQGNTAEFFRVLDLLDELEPG